MLAVSRAAVRGLATRQLEPAVWQICAGYATFGSKVVELNSDVEYEAALKDLSVTKSAGMFDFTAKWCGPCKMIAPVFESLASEFPTVRFFKVDIDNQSLNKTVTENSVAAVPTFVGYQGADRVTAFSGADKAMLRRLALELSGSHVKAPGTQ